MLNTIFSEINLAHFLILSAILFGCGIATILTKRNAIGVLIGLELILNAANINLVAFNKYTWSGAIANDIANTTPPLDGTMFALFIIVIAAAEAAIALAIFLNFYNNFATIDIERGQTLKG